MDVDEDARARLTDFVAGRGPALMRLAFLLTGERHAAEDLFQSALAKTIAKWHTLRNEDPEAYVRTAMVHEQISWWRRLRRHRETPLADAYEPSSADPSDRTDLRLALGAALLRLPPSQRSVLVLRYYEDLSESQAAAVMGCSVGTVRSRVHRAVARLRNLLPELDRTEETHDRHH